MTDKGKRSNKARAARTNQGIKRKLIDIRVSPNAKRASDGHTFTGPSLIAIAKNAKHHAHGMQSRLPGSWSSKVTAQERKPVYSSPNPLADGERASRYNPNPIVPNMGTRTYREFSEKLGGIITKRERYQIGDEGSTYQKPADKPQWRGDPCLFDDCVSAGRHDVRTRVNGHTMPIHIPSGTLPAWKIAPIRKPSKAQASAWIDVWRQAKQLAHAEALIELAQRGQ